MDEVLLKFSELLSQSLQEHFGNARHSWSFLSRGASAVSITTRIS